MTRVLRVMQRPDACIERGQRESSGKSLQIDCLFRAGDFARAFPLVPVVA